MVVTNAKISRDRLYLVVCAPAAAAVIAGNPCGKHVLGNRVIERNISPATTK
jgi:hypothetical protein